MMTIIHLPGTAGIYVDQLFGFVGPSEGFVILSGLLIGIFLGNRSEIWWRQKKIYRRIFKLYLAHVFIVTSLALLNFSIPNFKDAWQEFGFFTEVPLSTTILSSLLLLNQPRYLDVLPLFCGFLLFAPLICKQFSKSSYLPVFSLSLLLWIVSQKYEVLSILDLLQFKIPLPYNNQGPFRVLAWQLPFTFGIFLGERIVNRKSLPATSHFITILACAILILGFSLTHGIVQLDLPIYISDLFFKKANLGLFRILEFVSFTYLLQAIRVSYPKFLRPKALVFLGQHSLAVYVTHVVILYISANFRTVWHFNWPWYAQLACTLAAITCLFMSALAHREWTRSFLRRKQMFKLENEIKISRALQTT